MFLVRSSLLLSALLFAGCDSKVTSGGNAALQKQVQTITDCFPGLFAKGHDLLDLAELWRLNTTGSVPDPAAPFQQNGTGPINVSHVVDGCTILMTIRFFSPTGVEQTGIADNSTTLADKIGEAATDLRAMFPVGKPFMVGDWSISGTKNNDTFAGSGAFTGIIGGSTNGNELEELRTTEATPAAGPPPIAVATITEGACTLTFTTSNLVTDSFPTQQYPIGAVTVTIDGDDADSLADVTATVTFDNTPVVQIAIVGAAAGKFEFNVETRALTSVP